MNQNQPTPGNETSNYPAGGAHYLNPDALTDAFHADLLSALGPERTSFWRAPRIPYDTVITVVDGAGPAAVLTSTRPNTRYTKIVDVVAPDSDAAATVLRRVIDDSLARGDAGVKWQIAENDEHRHTTELLAAALGFSALRSPHLSAAGTEGVIGFVRWHGEWPHPQLAYYGQTTEFTCGAVAALTAFGALGRDPFGGLDRAGRREHEIAFWRDATNFPAIEPVGLAVTIDRLLAGTGVGIELFLDTVEPVMLDTFPDEMREYRAQLQAESRSQAVRRGIVIQWEHIVTSEITRRVAGGELALLLIDEEPMHGTSMPHWVLAHAVRGDTVLLHDPWSTAQQGESWVDSHDLPVSLEVLDRLAGFGSPAFRGVLFLRP